jgi:hypothetical protein
MEVESGSFDVASEFAFNGCNSATTYDGRYSIAITDSMFTMGGWSGDWQADPNQLKAHGETGRSSVETRGCTITTWTEVDLTFTSEDNFYGHVTYRKRVMGTCACCPQCTSTWSITGVRVTN